MLPEWGRFSVYLAWIVFSVDDADLLAYLTAAWAEAF
jgi:hypothetical protein